jgi:transcription elongation factor Elf1
MNKKQRKSENRQGHILIDSFTGKFRCLECGNEWYSNLLHGGGYVRGSKTCDKCGANSKGGFSAKRKAV